MSADPLDLGFYEALADDDALDLYDNAPCGYLSTAPDGRIVKANRTFARMVGVDAATLVGSTLSQLLTPGGRIYHETHYAPMLRMQGFAREIAVDLVRTDGARLPVLLNAVVKADDRGEPALVRVAVFDATERRTYEQELLRARNDAVASEARARELATTLQASLIPPAVPSIEGIEVAAEYRPAGLGDEVGGDFYDVFEVARGDWGVVVGDVCGKGAGAAAVTALVRHTVRAAATRARRPRSVLATLNEALLRQSHDRFSTVVYGRLRVEPGRIRLTVGSAGHWLPLRVSGAGRVDEVGRAGTVSGVVATPTLGDVTVELHPGDTVLFFTDGVLEARRDGEELGHDRLVALLRAHAGRPAAETAAGVLEEVLAFQHGLPRDDIALLVLRVPEG